MIKIFSQLVVALTFLCLSVPQASAQAPGSIGDPSPWSIEEDSFLRELGIIDDPFWGLSDFENKFLNDLFRIPPAKNKKSDKPKSLKSGSPSASPLPSPLPSPFEDFLDPPSVGPVPPKQPSTKPSNKDMDDFIESMMKELTEPKVIPFDKLKLARMAIGWRR